MFVNMRQNCNVKLSGGKLPELLIELQTQKWNTYSVSKISLGLNIYLNLTHIFSLQSFQSFEETWGAMRGVLYFHRIKTINTGHFDESHVEVLVHSPFTLEFKEVSFSILIPCSQFPALGFVVLLICMTKGKCSFTCVTSLHFICESVFTIHLKGYKQASKLYLVEFWCIN